jgi:hypothetical protein
MRCFAKKLNLKISKIKVSCVKVAQQTNDANNSENKASKKYRREKKIIIEQK